MPRLRTAVLGDGMGVGRIFFQGGTVGDFPKIFPGGAKTKGNLFFTRN